MKFDYINLKILYSIQNSLRDPLCFFCPNFLTLSPYINSIVINFT